MGIDEIQKTLGIDLLSFQGERKAESSEKSSAFSKILGEKRVNHFSCGIGHATL